MNPLRTASEPTEQIDLNRAVEETLVARTIGGAEDLLAEDLRSRALTEVLAGQECVIGRLDGRMEALAQCRLYSSVGVLLPADPQDPAFTEALRQSRQSGVIAALAAEPSLRFRIATESPERTRATAALLEQRLGWVNDPHAWVINLVHLEPGWIAEIGPLFWSRRFGSLERRPWSTTPLVAEILVRLAKVKDDQQILDPFCGTGTIVIAAGMAAPEAALRGSDIDPESIELAQVNLSRFGVEATTVIGTAEHLVAADASIDRVISNLPFGRRVGSHAANQTLYPAALAEIARVLTPSGRAVLLTDDKQRLTQAAARTRGLKIVRERMLRFSGVTPTAFVLTRTRSR